MKESGYLFNKNKLICMDVPDNVTSYLLEKYKNERQIIYLLLFEVFSTQKRNCK